MPTAVGDTKRPNVLIIGAARSGTTALSTFLAKHPEVFMSTPKEPHFLASGGQQPRFSGPGDDEMINRVTTVAASDYRALFAGAGTAQIRAEGSVTTQYAGADAIPMIHEYCAPDVRLITVLREPVSRAHSAYLYLRGRGHEPLTDFVAAIDAEDRRRGAGWGHMWHYQHAGRYAEQLQPFFREFGADRILAVLHEDLVDHPAETLSRVFSFVGLDPIEVDTGQEINRSGEPKYAALHGLMKLLRSSEPLRRAAKSVTSARLRERVRSANLDHPPLSDHARQKLADVYAQTIPELESLLGRDLASWKLRQREGAHE